MTRPASFDTRVMAYMPMLEKMASKFVPAQHREDVVQQAILLALDRWQDFDETGSFYKWMAFKFRHAADNRVRRKREVEDVDGTIAGRLTSPARQEDITYANQIVRRLSYTRDGRMLVRLGGGEMLKDISKRRGIGVERVRQLTERARGRLVKSVKVAA